MHKKMFWLLLFHWDAEDIIALNCIKHDLVGFMVINNTASEIIILNEKKRMFHKQLQKNGK